MKELGRYKRIYCRLAFWTIVLGRHSGHVARAKRANLFGMVGLSGTMICFWNSKKACKAKQTTIPSFSRTCGKLLVAATGSGGELWKITLGGALLWALIVY